MPSLLALLDVADHIVAARLEALTTKAAKTTPEQELEDAVQRVLDEYLDVIAGYVKRGKAIPQGVYDDMSAELNTVISDSLKDTYIAGALVARSDLEKALDIGVNWTAPNTDAMHWVESYTFDLVRGLEDTTKAQVQANITALQNDVSAFFGKPTTLGELRGNIEKYIPDWKDRLGHVWSSETRAEMIAITETTRASVEGQLDSVKYLKDEYGVLFIPIWETRVDEKVCGICGPRDNKQQGQGWTEPPPAHPNCRCGISFELAK